MYREEKELISMAKEGSPHAWEEIVKLYLPFVKSTVQRYFIPNMDRDDLLQEGMLALFKAVKTYDVNKNKDFKSFLEMCVKRQLISALRHATRRKDIPIEGYLPWDENINISLALVERELPYLSQEFKQKLSRLESTVLEKYLEGKSYNEIAKELGCSPKSVDNAIQRVKRKLRRIADSLSP